MAEYYYTSASLPMVSFEQAPPVTAEYFLETCKYTLKDADYKILISALLLPEAGSDFPAVSKWRSWETTLRNELARLRAQNTGFDADEFIKECDFMTGAYSAAKDALSAADPAAGEYLLDKARWTFLDELELGHHFDLTKLVVYYLKLQIAERRSAMTKENGEKKYEELYNHITDKIHQSYDGEL